MLYDPTTSELFHETIGPEFFEVIQMILPVIMIWATLAGLLFILGIMQYILRGIAIYKMSANRGLSNGWLGFIPFIHNYQLGKIAGEIEFGNKKVKNTGAWLLIMPIIYNFVCIIGYVIIMIPYFFNLFALSPNAGPEHVLGMIKALVFSLILYSLAVLTAQIFFCLFKYLALHKVFLQYNIGQKPVFYMIIAMFVPYAEAILLFMHRNRQMLETIYAPSVGESNVL